MLNRLWWLWRDAPPKERNASQDQAGAWPVALVNFRSQRAQATSPHAAPPGWMAGNVPVSGAWMPISIAFVQHASLARQVNLPPIGPVDDSAQRAHALQAALAASLAGVSAAPRR